MPAYLVGHITVNNDDLWQKYVNGVGESLAPFDCKILFRGKRVSVLAGNHEYDNVVVIEFSDYTALNDWFHSEKYQSLIPIRDEAADVVIATYEA
jgi:uncharacterized protein (DUF1330 family)